MFSAKHCGKPASWLLPRSFDDPVSPANREGGEGMPFIVEYRRRTPEETAYTVGTASPGSHLESRKNVAPVVFRDDAPLLDAIVPFWVPHTASNSPEIVPHTGARKHCSLPFPLSGDFLGRVWLVLDSCPFLLWHGTVEAVCLV